MVVIYVIHGQQKGTRKPLEEIAMEILMSSDSDSSYNDPSSSQSQSSPPAPQSQSNPQQQSSQSPQHTPGSQQGVFGSFGAPDESKESKF